ncbi:nucleoside deaminase [Paeniglutamicibacter sulfureus]|uniref:Guanine deaminase n=1 Tax=Paeniglutamicibacter sulfureus TaxID=43666 RepID=A0ABU2BKN8_9MICC|nr:nucleoside deaminase [Paeniglutamicibacter sulfureus]MDO2934916.1 nucleoside deaminase [Paeniglutamicibacter sulfureus]MDR7359206.1 guanine deaminase [Paeniglutamicibacter sulfureus]
MTGTTDSAVNLAAAIAIAADNVRNAGGPFGALIVAADGSRFEGVNRVTANNDPTAHAEVTAIRAACNELGTFDLTGAVLYSSCEPCPMCLASALWARVSRVVFASDRHEAAEAGFDDAAFYEYFEGREAERATLMPVERITDAGVDRHEPFALWAALDTRIEY